MSCDCYKIGGPWITFDPDCPAHGYEAQSERKERERNESELRDRIASLEQQVAALATQKDLHDPERA